MDFRRIISSTKSYKIALVVAIALLLLLSSISYRQINNMRKSADLVSTSLMVDREINNLFSKFSSIEASGYKSLIVNDSTFFDTYKITKRETEQSFLSLSELTKDIPDQLKYLDSVNEWRDSLDITINNLNKYRGLLEDDVEEKLMAEIGKMTSIFQKLNAFKLGMSKKKEALFKERMIAYKTETFFTPFISIILVVFSLLVFWLAFRKINNARKELIRTQAFVDNIIANSDNLITYFKPIRDENGKIIDFTFGYASNKIEDFTGKSVKDIANRKLSETYPETFINGTFEMYVNCMETGNSDDITNKYNFGNGERWLKSIASKLEDGVNVTTIDVTQEKLRNKNLKKLNENLFVKNAILNNAEVVAKIGSYSWYPDTDTSELSDNFYRLLGCKPGEFEPGFENFKSFVHPEDLADYEKAALDGLESRQIKEYIYRVIDKKGATRHWRTAGVMISEDGKDKMIGIVQDVTENIRKDKKLKKRNKALKRSNAELESFNRVVSHDLQEPLRKIQMFISLLSESEQKNLSEKGAAYFDKIDNAASRMQLLIKNLLTYSKIDSTHEDFVKIDLNKKLEKVEDNLSERLKEANVTLIKNDLPTIKGIRFQMEQLFNNLISNAIKYRNLKEDAKILIDASIVHKDQITVNFTKTSKNYHKIVISDNGIGFDQENAEKIFDIFERLHQKTEYSGTGIGLAICKKIVDNHHGFIHATSERGKGTTFYIYLPA
ncbi:ATP-binding protein [Aureibaculum sp. 2210JD6-5]|uniref:ATP-binding protein n=1 Tax=Aureibaculum sp. 2210JD6-5 TaxID=3103957 RepID=UPI002AAD1788|nr:ATP-binding protein [Aureibaculum sp. 2210JD6-5]MDY7394990.1 ATP-binding protein [Aureibaculum sp. 2210JD6-5]